MSSIVFSSSSTSQGFRLLGFWVSCFDRPLVVWGGLSRSQWLVCIPELLRLFRLNHPHGECPKCAQSPCLNFNKAYLCGDLQPILAGVSLACSWASVGLRFAENLIETGVYTSVASVGSYQQAPKAWASPRKPLATPF